MQGVPGGTGCSLRKAVLVDSCGKRMPCMGFFAEFHCFSRVVRRWLSRIRDLLTVSLPTRLVAFSTTERAFEAPSDRSIDRVLANGVKGAGVETLPTAIFGAVKQGIKPNIMAISALMLAISALFVTLSRLIGRAGQGRAERA